MLGGIFLAFSAASAWVSKLPDQVMLAGAAGRAAIGRLMSPEVLPAAHAVADKALALINSAASRHRREARGDEAHEIDMTGSPKEGQHNSMCCATPAGCAVVSVKT